MQTPEEAKRILEAALLSCQEPLSLNELKKLFDAEPESGMVRKLLEALRKDWSGRGVELVNVASGWRFQVSAAYQKYLDRLHPQVSPRYSRAVMETLSIIAYKQPVTRGDIEAIRGVAVNSHLLKTLEARGWVETVGVRDVPGKPALFATTPRFLDDLGLRCLEELPSLDVVTTIFAAPPEVQGEKQ